MITHTYGGKNYTLNAGVAYNALKNTMKADGLRCNFQRLNNSYPFGYIYDENGHIGFVGAAIKADHIDTLKVKEFHEGLISRLDEGRCIDQIFSYDGNEVGYTSDPNKQIPGFGDASLI